MHSDKHEMLSLLFCFLCAKKFATCVMDLVLVSNGCIRAGECCLLYDSHATRDDRLTSRRSCEFAFMRFVV